MQQLYDAALQAVLEVRAAGFNINCQDGRILYPQPNPAINQTKSIYVKFERGPHTIYTPWGELKLLIYGSDHGLAKLALGQTFLRKLQAYIEKIYRLNNDDPTIYRISQPILPQYTSEQLAASRISADDAQLSKGQSDFIVHWGYATLYRVHGFAHADNVFTQQTDDQTLDSPRAAIPRGRTSTDFLWRVMTALYSKELGKPCILEGYMKNLNTRMLQKLQSTEEPVTVKKKPCEECDKENCTLLCENCKRIYYCSPLCQERNSQVHKGCCWQSDDLSPIYQFERSLRTIDDIPGWVICIARILNEQPQYDLESDPGPLMNRKVLPLGDWQKYIICEILNRYAHSKYNIHWPLIIYGNGPNQHFTATRKMRPGGVALYNEPQCSLIELNDVYVNAIRSVKKGWKPTPLADNQRMYEIYGVIKSEEEWQLFIKPAAGHQEAALINCLAVKFKLNNVLECFEQLVENGGILFMWVNKDALVDVMMVFGFKWYKHYVS